MTNSTKQHTQEVIRRYKNQNAWERWHTRIRFLLCPIWQAVYALPPEIKTLVEIGCGSGCFANAVNVEFPDIRIYGYDPSAKKVSAASLTANNNSNVKFEAGASEILQRTKTDSICFIDVFYLIPRDRWDSILADCRESLNGNGILVIKDMDTKPVWKFIFNYLQESLAVNVLGITMGSKFYFEGRNAFTKRLEKAGFSVEARDLSGGYCYPHILYICRK